MSSDGAPEWMIREREEAAAEASGATPKRVKWETCRAGDVIEYRGERLTVAADADRGVHIVRFEGRRTGLHYDELVSAQATYVSEVAGKKPPLTFQEREAKERREHEEWLNQPMPSWLEDE